MGVLADKMTAGPFPYDARHQRGASLMPGVAAQVQNEYKALAPFNMAVVDSRSGGLSDGRRLESYPPRSGDNPSPGRSTVEVFDPEFQGGDLNRMVAADMLHQLPREDPVFAKMRSDFGATMTPEQNELNQRVYDNATNGIFGDQTGPKEMRPYDEWWDTHRLDQYLGAAMLPEGSPQREAWMTKMMTPNQLARLSEIELYLRSGVKQPTMSWGQ